MLISASPFRFIYRSRILRSRLTKHGRALARSEGAALVELSVTLPIIFLIMTGIFAFSIALYQRMALAQGVGAGAMALARDRGATQSNGTLDPCKDVSNAVTNAAPSLNTSTMKITIVINGTTKISAVAPNSGISCSGTALTANTSAQVLATYPCTIGVYNLRFSTCSLSSQVTEEIQ